MWTNHSTATFSITERALHVDQSFWSQNPEQGQLPVLMHLNRLRWILLLPFGKGLRLSSQLFIPRNFV